MLPALVKSLRENKDFQMATDGRQNWDYLYVSDGAEALISLLEKGKNGEIKKARNGENIKTNGKIYQQGNSRAYRIQHKNN